jgi:hypothetical protein
MLEMIIIHKEIRYFQIIYLIKVRCIKFSKIIVQKTAVCLLEKTIATQKIVVLCIN